jgi:bifunctional DNA-binding transcriptional regulator/antitoxin component of YhaV-PrlF toxin-antitoxin module
MTVEIYPANIMRQADYSVRITIPKDIVKKFSLKPHDVLLFIVDGDKITVATKEQYLHAK